MSELPEIRYNARFCIIVAIENKQERSLTKDECAEIIRRCKAYEGLVGFLQSKADIAKASADNADYYVPITIREIEEALAEDTK